MPENDDAKKTPEDVKKELEESLIRTIIEKPWFLEQILRRIESDEIVDKDGNPVA